MVPREKYVLHQLSFARVMLLALIAELELSVEEAPEVAQHVFRLRGCLELVQLADEVLRDPHFGEELDNSPLPF